MSPPSRHDASLTGMWGAAARRPSAPGLPVALPAPCTVMILCMLAMFAAGDAAYAAGDNIGNTAYGEIGVDQLEYVVGPQEQVVVSIFGGVYDTGRAVVDITIVHPDEHSDTSTVRSVRDGTFVHHHTLDYYTSIPGAYYVSARADGKNLGQVGFGMRYLGGPPDGRSHDDSIQPPGDMNHNMIMPQQFPDDSVQPPLSPPVVRGLTVHTDRPHYEAGDIIRIYGTAEVSHEVMIRVTMGFINEAVRVDPDGTYSLEIETAGKGGLIDGTHRVIAGSSGSLRPAETTFTFGAAPAAGGGGHILEPDTSSSVPEIDASFLAVIMITAVIAVIVAVFLARRHRPAPPVDPPPPERGSTGGAGAEKGPQSIRSGPPPEPVLPTGLKTDTDKQDSNKDTSDADHTTRPHHIWLGYKQDTSRLPEKSPAKTPELRYTLVMDSSTVIHYSDSIYGEASEWSEFGGGLVDAIRKRRGNVYLPEKAEDELKRQRKDQVLHEMEYKRLEQAGERYYPEIKNLYETVRRLDDPAMKTDVTGNDTGISAGEAGKICDEWLWRKRKDVTNKIKKFPYKRSTLAVKNLYRELAKEVLKKSEPSEGELESLCNSEAGRKKLIGHYMKYHGEHVSKKKGELEMPAGIRSCALLVQSDSVRADLRIIARAAELSEETDVVFASEDYDFLVFKKRLEELITRENGGRYDFKIGTAFDQDGLTELLEQRR